ncbi:MAG TPA: helix-turn-helix domain-containing protein [Pseudonocardiaceae bacterium]|nr:helix-turn-helix domain-containing protein [Pseudonocardiaceae bacterium]
MQVESTQLFTVKDVAGMFAVSSATVYRLVESGELPALRFGTGKGSLRVRGEAVNAYLAACTVSARPADAAASTTVARRLCAHADQNGAGMHWLEPGDRCPLSAEQTTKAGA